MIFTRASVAAFFIILCTQLVVAAESLEKERETLRKTSKDLFDAQEWEKLDSFHDNLLKENKRNSYGIFLVSYVDDELKVSKYHKTSAPDKDWMEWYKRLETWKRERPDSLLVSSLQVNFWNSFAWKARGNAFAHKVKEESWPIFRERLETSNKIFLEAIAKYEGEPHPSPSLYKSVASIAMGQSWSEEKIDRLVVQPCIKGHPGHYYIYVSMATAFEPKWGGVERGNYIFLEKVAKSIGGEIGAEVYARSIINKAVIFVSGYPYEFIDQKLLFDGFIQTLKSSPDNMELIEKIISFGYRYRAYNELIARIRDEANPPSLDVFFQKSDFGRNLKKSLAEETRPLEFLHYIAPKLAYNNYNANDLAYDSSSGKALVGFEFINVLTFPINAERKDQRIPEGIIDGNKRRTRKVVISPDGSLLFTCSGSDEFCGFDSMRLCLYQKNKGEWLLKRESKLPYRGISSAVFTSDSKKLIFSHNGRLVRNKKGKKTNKYSSSHLYSWDVSVDLAEPVIIHECRPNDRHLSIILRNQGSEVYFGQKSLKCIKSNTDGDYNEQPLAKDGYEKGETLTKFVQLGKEPVVIALTKAKKDHYLVSIDLESGEVKSRKKINEWASEAYSLNVIQFSDGKWKVFISGLTASIISYDFNYNRTDPIEFQYDSITVTDKTVCMFLKDVRGNDGNHYLFQGTSRGRIGVFKIDGSLSADTDTE